MFTKHPTGILLLALGVAVAAATNTTCDLDAFVSKYIARPRPGETNPLKIDISDPTSPKLHVYKEGKLDTTGPVCPFGLRFDVAACDCVDDACNSNSNSNSNTCRRGIDIVKASKGEAAELAQAKKVSVVLTHYAALSYSLLDESHQEDKAAYDDNLKKYLKTLQDKFVFTRLVGDRAEASGIAEATVCLFISPDTNAAIVAEHHIKPLVDRSVKPCVNVYPSAKDSTFLPKDGSVEAGTPAAAAATWQNVFAKIDEIDRAAAKLGSPKNNKLKYAISTMVYDMEACQCGDEGQRRKLFDDWKKDPDFIIMGSNGPGAAGSGLTGGAQSFGFGEIYWNVGELWPCKGGPEQYETYEFGDKTVCTSESSYRVFKDQPAAFIDYLDEASSKSPTSTAPLASFYYNEGKKQPTTTLPLFSTESLYAQRSDAQRSPELCAQLAFNGKSADPPDTGAKACGTFDGFSYWSWEKYVEFMRLYATRYKVSAGTGPGSSDYPIVGIYDAMFLPEQWLLEGETWSDATTPDFGDAPWPAPAGPAGHKQPVEPSAHGEKEPGVCPPSSYCNYDTKAKAYPFAGACHGYPKLSCDCTTVYDEKACGSRSGEGAGSGSTKGSKNSEDPKDPKDPSNSSSNSSSSSSSSKTGNSSSTNTDNTKNNIPGACPPKTYCQYDQRAVYPHTGVCHGYPTMPCDCTTVHDENACGPAGYAEAAAAVMAVVDAGGERAAPTSPPSHIRGGGGEAEGDGVKPPEGDDRPTSAADATEPSVALGQVIVLLICLMAAF
eukprot:g5961.t1